MYITFENASVDVSENFGENLKNVENTGVDVSYKNTENTGVDVSENCIENDSDNAEVDEKFGLRGKFG